MSQAEEEFNLTASQAEEFNSTFFNEESNLKSPTVKEYDECPTSEIELTSPLQEESTSSSPGTVEDNKTSPNTDDLVIEPSVEEDSEFLSPMSSLKVMASSQDLLDSSPPRALFWSSPFGSNPVISPTTREKNELPDDEMFVTSTPPDVENQCPSRKKFFFEKFATSSPPDAEHRSPPKKKFFFATQRRKYASIVDMPSTSSGLRKEKKRAKVESSEDNSDNEQIEKSCKATDTKKKKSLDE